jgi:hypothetical protein
MGIAKPYTRPTSTIFAPRYTPYPILPYSSTTGHLRRVYTNLFPSLCYLSNATRPTVTSQTAARLVWYGQDNLLDLTSLLVVAGEEQDVKVTHLRHENLFWTRKRRNGEHELTARLRFMVAAPITFHTSNIGSGS